MREVFFLYLMVCSALTKRISKLNRMCGSQGYNENSPECSPCEEAGIIYSSIVISVENTGDLAECRAYCQTERRCLYFSLDTRREHCHLKASVGSKLRAPSSYISGSKFCDIYNEINDDDMIKKSVDNELMVPPSFINRNSRTLEVDQHNDPYPVIIVKHGSKEFQTILAGVPAHFGLNITKHVQMSGRTVFAQPADLCNFSPTEMRKKIVNIRTGLDPGLKLFGIVRRGLCLFSTKAENAVAAGFDGMVILDDKENTAVRYIMGANKDKLKDFPIVFLRKAEADILEQVVKMSGETTIITIQDSALINWYDVKRNNNTTVSSTTASKIATTTRVVAATTTKPVTSTTAKPTTTEKTARSLSSTTVSPAHARSSTAGPTNSTKPNKAESEVQRPTQVHTFILNETDLEHEQMLNYTTASSLQLDNSSVVEQRQNGSETTAEHRGIHLSPLSVGAIIGSLVLALLLVISIFTLAFGRYRKRSRRRENRLRCQQALSQLSMRKGEDNGGFGEPARTERLPKSVKYLFECPVCLDFAWAPRKIYQCREGHIVCEVCFSNPDLQLCPMCRIPIRGPGQVSRNRQLEELSAALMEMEPSSSSETNRRFNAQTDNTPSAPPINSSCNSSTTAEVAFHSDDTEYTSDEAFEDTFEDQDNYSEAGPLTVILPPE